MLAGVVECLEYNTPSPNATGCSSASASAHLYADPECIQSVSISNTAPPALQFAKTRKLSLDSSDLRKYVKLFLSVFCILYVSLEQIITRCSYEWGTLGVVGLCWFI